VTALSAAAGQAVLWLCVGFAGLGVLFIYEPNAQFLASYAVSIACGCFVGYLSTRFSLGDALSVLISFTMIPVGWFLVAIGMGILESMLVGSSSGFVYYDDPKRQGVQWINEWLITVVRLLVTIVISYAALFVTRTAQQSQKPSSDC
jgi:hypothetical protein